ncbi:MAG TPA: NAD(P)/FAD-dependent oxidoreductase [Vicinamibacteria bacterium]|nr:NAD(P)/FAD-dependent oxidoreductase [Vicinamibacteria bacterium]
MERADVLIVGGGPAGSSCAEALVSAGRDVLVLDRAAFPRDKPCAGWITPDVVSALRLDLDAYGRDHTLQAVSRFRTGRIGGRATDVDYGARVSYGIRRCEFDAYLLRRSGARTRFGESVADVRRDGRDWVVNGRFAARVLVGAGGHFCPVARALNGPPPRPATVVAREVEFLLEGDTLAACRVEGDRPELYFCPDLRGYGWCFRKGSHLNVGFGRVDEHALPSRVKAFVDWLVGGGRIARPPEGAWRGHAYVVRESQPRRVAGEGVLLAGDAAGLAFPASGEGILPAVASGQLAAEAILHEEDDARRESRYREGLDRVLGRPAAIHPLLRPLAVRAAGLLLASPAFRRRVVLDRWFLHRSSAERPAAEMVARPADRRPSPD